MKFVEANTIRELAEMIDCKVLGDPNKLITGVNRIEEAGDSDLTFLADERYVQFLHLSKAGCIIISDSFKGIDDIKDKNFLLADNPRNAFNSLLILLDEKKKQKRRSFIHASAVIGNECNIHASAYISANCTIGDCVSIGENTVLMPGVVIADNVIIGKNTTIYANVSVYEDCEIGDNCIIHSGAVIGADGFGYQENEDGSYSKIPQLGNVQIMDNVEIGANSTIDRALLGSTIIGKGVKIDNLVQVAHNVFIDENTALAAQVGISGSSKIGKRNRIAGQVGIAGHLSICDDVLLMAQSGVPNNITKPGAYFGTPIRERMKAFRIEAVVNNLPELKKEVSELSKKLASLDEK